ncbi:hypothetical protein BT96DRAFT_994171 [Gymnopus androsaceus JB14]|uniref:Uncharacterized protein n=1 Tax=Gymnopus androsaceus JB14 TaxID=1447944 RepID=A0A6A4HMG4_9AGAR|nr:hypothetical protein BT96DRAFT_994171 [Gymnopus androsaceus JB14]
MLWALLQELEAFLHCQQYLLATVVIFTTAIFVILLCASQSSLRTYGIIALVDVGAIPKLGKTLYNTLFALLWHLTAIPGAISPCFLGVLSTNLQNSMRPGDQKNLQRFFGPYFDVATIRMLKLESEEYSPTSNHQSPGGTLHMAIFPYITINTLKFDAEGLPKSVVKKWRETPSFTEEPANSPED